MLFSPGLIERINLMISTHLRKKDDPNKDYLYAYTEMLAQQPDMIPCDKRGNPVGVAGEITGGGMRPREPEAPNAELTAALEAITALKAEIEALKTEPAEKTVEESNEESDEETETEKPVDMIDKMSRTVLFVYLKRTHGEKADYLKGNWSKTALLDEAEKLQAAADLEDR